MNKIKKSTTSSIKYRTCFSLLILAIIKLNTGKSNTNNKTSETGEYIFFDRSKIIKKSHEFFFEGEYIIVPGEGSFVPHYFNGKFDLHQRTYAIHSIDTSRLLNKYLFYFVLKNNSLFIKYSVGSTVRSLRASSFNWINVHKWPKIFIQKNIIDIIEPIETANLKLDLIVEKLEYFLRSLKTKDTTFFLSEVAEVVRNKPQGIVQVSAKALNKRTSILKGSEFPGTYKTNSFYTDSGVLLINTIRTYLEKFAILSFPADVNGTLGAFKIKAKWTSILHNLLNDDFWRTTILLSQGTKMPVIKINDLMNKIKFKEVWYEIDLIAKLLILLAKIKMLLEKIQELMIKLLIKV